MAHPFIAADRTAQVVLRFEQTGENVENVLWYQGTAEWTETTLTSLANAIASAVVANWLANQNTETFFQSVIATDWSSQTGPQVIQSISGSNQGTNAGVSLPNNVTVAIKKQTAHRGRSFRGRLFWIGMNNSMRTDNHINSGAVSAFLAAIAAVDTAANAVNSAVPVVVSQFTNNAPRVGSALVTPITHYSVDPNLDSQRRRLPGHNRHR